jgi:hypothetical protein
VTTKPRVISASLTPLLKFGASAFFLYSTIALALNAVEVARSDVRDARWAAVSAVTMGLTFWGAWLFFGLKRVALGDGELRISNYRREIVVPLRDVEEVEQKRFLIMAVAIRFARDTDFGRRVLFFPKGRSLLFTWTHPMVDRLRHAVAEAKKRGIA